MVHTLLHFVKQNAQRVLLALLLLSSTFAQAQGPVPGYDYLGACSGHNYYISKAFVFGNNIGSVVADFQAKTVVPDNEVYAAAIVNATENACLTSLMQTYNSTLYGGIGLAAGQDWGDRRNAWIGLTDAAQEGNFGWSNGQPNCQDFRNWNVGEPNNFAGVVSNGEDYTEILIMGSYQYGNSTNDPLGKWNDWWNQNITTPTGQNLGPTMLAVIIEVGKADCPPAPRGNLGCSHGFWKNAKDAAWAGAGYNRTQTFSSVFNINNGRDAIIIGVTTLQGALELGGGDYFNLARQGVAALLNASRGFYPYTPAEITLAVKNMFEKGKAVLPAVTVNGTTYTGGIFTDAGSLATYLDNLNNLGCPLNNKGETTTSSRSAAPSANNLIVQKDLAISGFPNPSSTGFSIQIDGLSNERAGIKVTDLNGRLIEQRTNIAGSQILKIGANYGAGMYNVEVIQGAKRKQVKLVKQ